MRGLRDMTLGIGRLGLCLALTAGVIACSPTLPLSPDSADAVVERVSVAAVRGRAPKAPVCGRHSLGGAAENRSDQGIYAEDAAYRVGPGDTLRFNIFGEEGMRDVTARVDAEGVVQLPVIEVVHVAGQTPREIQAALKRAYGVEFIDPWVTVDVQSAESAPVYLLGEFRAPGVRYLSKPITLIEALALGGGLEEDAFLPGARLLRDGQVCTVDLNALLKTGRFDQNVAIRPRDAIYAPQRADMSVYVLGAVGSPQAIAFGVEGRSLMQALAMAGGVRPGVAGLSAVRVVRSNAPTEGELLVVDAGRILAGAAMDLPLAPGDVVFVPQTPLQDWNTAIGQILPSIQMIGGILTPLTVLQSLGEKK